MFDAGIVRFAILCLFFLLLFLNHNANRQKGQLIEIWCLRNRIFWNSFACYARKTRLISIEISVCYFRTSASFSNNIHHNNNNNTFSAANELGPVYAMKEPSVLRQFVERLKKMGNLLSLTMNCLKFFFFCKATKTN